MYYRTHKRPQIAEGLQAPTMSTLCLYMYKKVSYFRFRSTFLYNQNIQPDFQSHSWVLSLEYKIKTKEYYYMLEENCHFIKDHSEIKLQKIYTKLKLMWGDPELT